MSDPIEPPPCRHVPRCRGLFSPCVTAWLAGPPIGTPESVRLGRLAHQALHPSAWMLCETCHYSWIRDPTRATPTRCPECGQPSPALIAMPAG